MWRVFVWILTWCPLVPSLPLHPPHPLPLQKRNGLQMNQKMPTQGTFRSSLWALTWPIKSISTNPLAAWSHQSEKLKTNAEFQGPCQQEGGVGHPFFVGAERQTWWQGVVWRCFCLPPQFYMSEENWKGPPMCIPLTLLPCFLVNDLIYKCIHRDVYNWQSSKDCTAP